MLKRLWKDLRPIGSVDGTTRSRVTGWATGPGRIKVEALVNGVAVANCSPSMERLDVAATYPNRRKALRSGFSLDLPAGAITDDGLAEVEVVARTTMPPFRRKTIGSFRAVGPELLRKLETVSPIAIRSPFPRDVTDLVLALDPELGTDLPSEDGQRSFVERLRQLLATPGVNALPPFAAYARYLTHTYAHCQFVGRHFPAFNGLATEGAADFNAKPNSIRELFPIIHHLYVLRSHGVEGDFAEFGCFKGYSSAMLSFACKQLGMPMHIFDSFAGLPPSEGSGYQSGQYTGPIEEVRSNLRNFGAADIVTLHQGFFADSLQRWRPDRLACLWMDVDLESSARDLMVVAPAVDDRGAVFSHECTASIFAGSRPESAPRLDNPIAPLLKAFEDMQRPLSGHYVAGYTGAFWSHDAGVPVLRSEPLFDLVESLTKAN